MPYRLKLDEPLSKGFQRIMNEQISRAVNVRLSEHDASQAVHETRKCIKRMRALIRLFRSVLGKEIFKETNTELRDIASLLSELRDAHVMIDTSDALQKRCAGNDKARFEPIKSALKQNIAKAESAADVDGAKAAARRLRKLGKKISSLKIDEVKIEDLASGMERSYREGRKAFRQAYTAGTNENFHEWRKAVQQHWRQMQLMSEGWPEYFNARARAARELAETLGQDHDLAMVVGFIGSQNPPIVKKVADKKRLQAILEMRQQELRAKARLLGTKLYTERTSALGRHTLTYWHVAISMVETPPTPKRKT